MSTLPGRCTGSEKCHLSNNTLQSQTGGQHFLVRETTLDSTLKSPQRACGSKLTKGQLLHTSHNHPLSRQAPSPISRRLLATWNKAWRLASSPSTILRCLNRVALSFLTSWILSVDFLTSTWSFLLNMVQCEPPAAARTGTTIDTTAPRRRSTSIPMPINRLIYHPASDARRQRAWLKLYHVKSASNFAHTPPIRCTWRPSWEAAQQRCARHLGGAMTSSVIQFVFGRRDRGQVYNIRGN